MHWAHSRTTGELAPAPGRDLREGPNPQVPDLRSGGPSTVPIPHLSPPGFPPFRPGSMVRNAHITNPMEHKHGIRVLLPVWSITGLPSLSCPASSHFILWKYLWSLRRWTSHTISASVGTTAGPPGLPSATSGLRQPFFWPYLVATSSGKWRERLRGWMRRLVCGLQVGWEQRSQAWLS